MNKLLFSKLLIILMLLSCNRTNEISKYSKFIFNFYGIKPINIGEVDSYSDLINSKEFCPNCIYGIYFDLDKFKITNDSGKYTRIIPLIFPKQENNSLCKVYPALTLYIKDENIIIKNWNSFHYTQILNFERTIDTYCMRRFTRKELSFESRWNNIIINRDSSFKKYLFPVLTSMLNSYLNFCIKNEKNAHFSRDAKGNIKDFVFEVDSIDLNISPKNLNRQ